MTLSQERECRWTWRYAWKVLAKKKWLPKNLLSLVCYFTLQFYRGILYANLFICSILSFSVMLGWWSIDGQEHCWVEHFVCLPLSKLNLFLVDQTPLCLTADAINQTVSTQKCSPFHKKCWSVHFILHLKKYRFLYSLRKVSKTICSARWWGWTLLFLSTMRLPFFCRQKDATTSATVGRSISAEACWGCDLSAGEVSKEKHLKERQIEKSSRFFFSYLDPSTLHSLDLRLQSSCGYLRIPAD